jgi:uncharacterized protein
VKPVLRDRLNVDIRQIPSQGLRIQDEFSAHDLDIEADIFSCPGPIKIDAYITKIANAVSARIAVKLSMATSCSRCLASLQNDLERNIDLDFPADPSEPNIDLAPYIRDEIILDYPVKPLCSPECKGLCFKCGKNLNEGNCNCKSK